MPIKENDEIELSDKIVNNNILDSENEDVLLIDINTRKKWIAYLTRHKKNVSNRYSNTKDDEYDYYLTFYEIKDNHRYSFQLTEDHFCFTWANECKFLSISPDGTRLVLSFLTTNNQAEFPATGLNNNCIVFKLSDDRNKITVEKLIRFQGRAVFSKDFGYLMLINRDLLEFYNKEYEKIHWFNLRKLSATKLIPHLPQLTTMDYMQYQPWSHPHENLLKHSSSLDKRIIAMSRHIHQNVLLTSFANDAQVWSISDNGVRLTAIKKKEDEEIMAFSDDYKFLATFVDDQRYINIYNVKSGLVVYRLYPAGVLLVDKKFQVSYIRFCPDACHVIMIGYEKNEFYLEDENVAIILEIWHMESGKSVYFEKNDIRILNNGKGIIQPYVKVKNDNVKKNNLGSYLQNDSDVQPTSHIHSDNFEEYDLEQQPIILEYKDNLRRSHETVSTLEHIKLTDKSKHQHRFIWYYVKYNEYNNLEAVSKDIDIYQSENMSSSTHHDVYPAGNSNLRAPLSKFEEAFPDNQHINRDIGGSRSASTNKINLNKWHGIFDNGAIIEEYAHIEERFADYRNLTCFVREYENKIYLLGFGQHLIQLWHLPKSTTIAKHGESQDELLFIHACKAPDYSFYSTFEESWSINATSIKFIKNEITENQVLTDGSELDVFERIIFFATKDEKENSDKSNNDDDNNQVFIYQEISEEVFIPFNQLVDKSRKSRIGVNVCLKSACQALHFLDTKQPVFKGTKKRYDKIYQTTKRIILDCIDFIGKISTDNTYFCSIAGSNILSMLASFEEGRRIIFKILKIKKLPISLYSYGMKLTQQQAKDNLSTNENALTVLIKSKNLDLYKLLFNRILADSKTIGVGCLSAITDALIYLQERSDKDVLLSSIEKLTYLYIDPNKLPIMEDEINYVMHTQYYSKDFTSSIRSVPSYSSNEQITRYDRGRWGELKYWWSIKRNYEEVFTWGYIKEKLEKYESFRSLENWFIIQGINNVIKVIKKMFQKYHPEKLTLICVVPLPHFLSYSEFQEDRRQELPTEAGRSNQSKWFKHPIQHINNHLNRKNINEEEEEKKEGNLIVLPNKKESAFIRLATNQDRNSIFKLGDTILEVLLQYKWSRFVWLHFFVMYIVYLTFFIGYMVGVSFAREIFGYNPGSLPVKSHWAPIIFMFFAIIVLFVQEIRQLMKTNKYIYIYSPYNWIDFATIILSIISFSLLVSGNEGFNAVNSFTVLFIWLDAILRLRVVRQVGIALETIIQMIISVREILFIMLVVICAFTNAYMNLLSHEGDKYFQEKYNFTEFNITMQDVSSQNDFKDIAKTFSNLWFFLFGVWDPVNDGDAGDNKVLLFLSMLFSFITIIVFFNLLIAYMNSAIKEVKKRGRGTWISHFADVMAEIELLWCWDSKKKKRKYNPTYVYYLAHLDAITENEEKLQEETRALIRKLNVTFAEQNIESEMTEKKIKKSFEKSENLEDETNALIDQLEAAYTDSESAYQMLVEKIKKSFKKERETFYNMLEN